MRSCLFINFYLFFTRFLSLSHLSWKVLTSSAVASTQALVRSFERFSNTYCVMTRFEDVIIKTMPVTLPLYCSDEQSVCVCVCVGRWTREKMPSSACLSGHTHYSAQREALYSAQPAHPSIQVTKQLWMESLALPPPLTPPNRNPAPSRPLRSGQRRLFFTASSSFSLRPQSSLSNEQPLFCHFLPLSSFSFAVTPPAPRPPDWNLTQIVNIWTDYDLFFLTTVPPSFYVHSSFYSLVFFRLKTPGWKHQPISVRAYI